MWGTRLTTVVTASLLFLGLVSGSALGRSRSPMHAPKAVELRDTLRDLWVDHIFWVRAAAWGTRAGDAEAARVAEERFGQNAKALGAAIAPYYGKEAGDKLTGLLADHFEALRSYMTAAYAGNAWAKEEALKTVAATAYAIASFVSGANPSCPLVGLVSLLSTHAAHQQSEIDAVGSRDCATEAETWDSSKKHVYGIADTLAEGIVRKFPRKF